MILNKTRIGIDLIGGELSPLEVLKYSIPALKKAAKRNPDVIFFAAGPKEVVEKNLSRFPNIHYVDARKSHNNHGDITNLKGEIIDKNEDELGTSITHLIKKKKNKDINAIFSSGNTGKLLAKAYKIGLIEGVDKPALTAIIPTHKRGQPAILLDVGATLDVTPYNLYQYAVMGAEFYSIIYGVKEPRVRILNVGEERSKGTRINLAAYKLLQSIDGIQFTGYIEGKGGVFLGKSDVIVTSGEMGNLLIKSSEGALHDLFQPIIKSEIKGNLFSLLGGIVSTPGRLSARVRQRLSPDKYNGALFLGLKGIVVKGHSTSNRFAFYNGIENTIKYLNSGIAKKIRHKFIDKNWLDELKKLYHEPFRPLSINKKIIQVKERLQKHGYSIEQSNEIIDIIRKTFTNNMFR
jgi:glycerol-3-phosphate acyltransferase PlsX